MFWNNKKLEEQVFLLNKKMAVYVRTIFELKEENSIIKAENEILNNKIIKYQALCHEIVPVVEDFKPAKTSKEAREMFSASFCGDFYCLEDVDVNVLNIFLEKICAIKRKLYRPSANAIASCDDFFVLSKQLTKREYLLMLYSLLDIRVTSRRFESFYNEIGTDELINIIETIFSYIAQDVNNRDG